MAEKNEKSIQQRLVEAGIAEINRSGVQNFSVRRVALSCGVSCAAPYKHFKDKKAFFAAIIKYIQELWRVRQEAVIKANAPDLRKQLVAISLDYINFLVENPHFRSIIMLKDPSFDAEYMKNKGGLSARSKELIQEYCKQVHMPEETAKIKMYTVRAMIYGSALMFDNNELPYTPEVMKWVEHVIDREFDLT
ncbi:MAG: TetR/AcrR family transcriptional regulator [Planctomycetia bacterium]|nr:TetR/AcrR family transcriptional regulator [Planctomycetia bacterium]